MSSDKYISMSTERLLELFTDAAKRTGFASELLNTLDSAKIGVAPPEPMPMPGRVQAAGELIALAEALHARGLPTEAKRLFEVDDPAVRVSAALYLSDVDPEMASAAIAAAYARLPTREVFDLKRRALRVTPLEPTLKEMSDDALVARFEDAATREYATRFLDRDEDSPGDMTERNRIVTEVWKAMRELKARGALGRLVPLLASPNITVRREAATACLYVAEQASIAVLEEVAVNGKYNDSVQAEDALDSWRKNGFAIQGI
jgi:HEAT repeat protein